MMVPAEIVDAGALFKVVWVSLAGGVGVAVAYSLVVLGAARAGDERRRSRRLPAVAYGLVALLGLAACAWALWRGYHFVVDK